MNCDSRRIHMMLGSKSRAKSNDFGKRRNSSIISKTITASKLCRCDALGSQIDTNALVSLEKKPYAKHSSQNQTDRLGVMQEQMEKLEDLRETIARLDSVEGEKNRAINERSEIKQVAHEANMKARDEITPRKSSELYAEVRTLKELLTNKQEDLKIKDKNISSLKLELEKAKSYNLKIAVNDASSGQVKERFSPLKAFKIRLTDWLSNFKRRVQELEDELENRKLSESKIFDAWLSKSRQFEEIKIELKESLLEIASLHEKLESLGTSYNGKIKSPAEKEIEKIKSELKLAKENEKIVSSKAKALKDEMSLLKNGMKLANEAEEKSRRALDDLTLALKEVASEASEAKKKLSAKQLELGLVKKEAGDLKDFIKSTKDRYKMFLDEAKKETELYRKTTERLKLEADEALSAWNGKEMSFVVCIKEVQEERDLALHEATKLNESLKASEQRSNAAREENYKLRDILKKAINEANVAKAAGDVARQENCQLKDCLNITG
ncbi:putative pentatricopeptide repeat-containing protein-like [Capsicum annuum]|nr:putative WEB family protein At1g65010, chloroplastic [Capsicum annuum]KAF3627644.1 putative pentatricopeptide repeat-containing protein-like [Capsicum annuum]KAF3651701.1 putative pentatricopeptide repeat-containing protein-like [Capsicum annuum]